MSLQKLHAISCKILPHGSLETVKTVRGLKVMSGVARGMKNPKHRLRVVHATTTERAINHEADATVSSEAQLCDECKRLRWRREVVHHTAKVDEIEAAKRKRS